MKKILYIINVDWFFISHFLPVGLEGIKRGYEVHIACGITDKKEYLENLGFIVHPLSISRSGTSLKTEIKTIIEMYTIIKSIGPQLLEFFTIKPVLYGGIVSRFLKVPKKIFYITGLGYVFIAKGLKGFIVRNIVKTLYKLAISGKNSSIITENIYDKELINSLNAVNDNQIKIIRGAGVDLSKYYYIEENNENIKISQACRLLKDKGVFEYIDAAKILKQKLPNVEFEIYGDIDIHNPASLTEDDIEEIKKEGFIKVHGFSTNIAKVFSDTNIVVLPSYREGLPKVLIEAAACGRAVITTDVPGCRDAIEPNVTGLLCQVRNFQSLANQIEKLILDKDLRNSMGKEGRELAKKEFDIKKVVEKHFDIYEG
ncbi:glycosyltransferase family 4 protein [Aliarcobacter butzleri]|uniref:glycosyltransferase family 4 protein n=1 Tax=Aliarcobacter butzleri TaxID=28197 RepID=UPI00125F154B|nr:glycosyltransferase family 4 protein [Aliarcobacter butzleri]MCT7626128.1 glycosyltransferase family 4 protein [Aliarcobacter butzleri]MCT7644153.1 glycosyltransferase family 4 protein [Aliarcobacter butzleri]